MMKGCQVSKGNDMDLYITHYCIRGTDPWKNIMLLPEAEAFRKAAELAAAYEGTASSGRFADFINYYPRRKTADRIVREEFIRLGGCPRLEHPYSFVLGESNYLKNWYDDGAILRLRLDTVPDSQISFTPGDSCARFERNELPVVWTKQMLLEKLHAFGDSQEELIRSIAPYGYVEAQLWDRLGQ